MDSKTHNLSSWAKRVILLMNIVWFMQASKWGGRIIFQYTDSGESGVLFSSIKTRGMYFFSVSSGGSVAYVRDV